jgi:dethiobiotin synthetase
MRLIVAGTDTDVGKTVVSALLVQGLAAHYWKPVQSGLADGSDSQWVREMLSLPPGRILKESYRLQAPVSPHWAAEQEQVVLDPQRLALPAGNEPLVLETAGGVMTPMGRDWLQIDQIRRWGLPLVLVARSGLGTLNHTLLTLEALRHRSIPVLGLVLNGPRHPDNPRTLADLGGVPVLAQLPRLEPLNALALQRHWQESDLSENLRP